MALKSKDDFGKRPRYRLISPDGADAGTFNSVQEAASAAAMHWPGVEQRNHENGRDGWDLEAIRPQT